MALLAPVPGCLLTEHPPATGNNRHLDCTTTNRGPRPLGPQPTPTHPLHPLQEADSGSNPPTGETTKTSAEEDPLPYLLITGQVTSATFVCPKKHCTPADS